MCLRFRGKKNQTPILCFFIIFFPHFFSFLRGVLQRQMFKQVVRRFSTNTRPFNILGIQQIAIGGLSKQKLVNLWSDEFGIKAVGEFKSERENVDETILSLGQGAHAVEIDLMQPLDPTRSPKVHDPSLNHIGLWVDNIKVAVDHLTKRGMRFTPGGIRKGAAGFDVVFIHPKGNEQFPLCGQGVLIELVQAPEEVIKALGKSN